MIRLKEKPLKVPEGLTYAEAIQRPLKTTFEIAAPHAAQGNICMVCSTWRGHIEVNIIINLQDGEEVHSTFAGRFIEKNFLIEEEAGY